MWKHLRWTVLLLALVTPAAAQTAQDAHPTLMVHDGTTLAWAGPYAYGGGQMGPATVSPFIGSSGIARGPIKLPDGTAAAPSLTFASEPGLGLYKAATGVIGIGNDQGQNPVALSYSGYQLGSGQWVGWSSTTSALGSIDTILTRDAAANTLALKNGANAQTFRVYGTTTGPSYLQIGSLGLTTNDTNSLALGTNGTTRWVLNGTTGALVSNGDAAYDIGTVAANRPNNVYAIKYYGDGSALTGIAGVTGGVTNAGVTNIISGNAGADSATTISTANVARWIFKATTGAGALVPNLDATYDIGSTALGVKTAYQSKTALATTSTDGVVLTNATAATGGATVQISPRLRQRGNAWDTAASQTVDFFTEVLPASAATPTGMWKLGYSLNGAAATYPLTVTSAGRLTVLGQGSFGGGVNAPSFVLGGSANLSVLTTNVDGKLNLTDNGATTGIGFDVTTDSLLKVRNRAQNADGNISFATGTASTQFTGPKLESAAGLTLKGTLAGALVLDTLVAPAAAGKKNFLCVDETGKVTSQATVCQ